jgi:acyl-CoA synthetase (AMP-forming)/AMP-acid ligase II
MVLKPDQQASEAEILAHARKRIAGYKLPKSIDFVDALPRTPSGKILKRELRERYWQGQERRVH